MPRLDLPGLDAQPRVTLATVPTPLQDATRLRAALGGADRCPRVLLKRDDLTGLALGGSKARKLEFLIADAIVSEATMLVTSGGLESNFARMTAAAGRIHGLPTALVLTTSNPRPEAQGNLLLDVLFGAEVRFAPEGDPLLASSPGEADAIAALVRDLRARGERPYVIPLGGSNAIGTLGYVAATVELLDQLEKAGVRPSRLYVASGSRGTAAGLVLGAKLAGTSYRVRGVAVSGGDPGKTEHAVTIAREAAIRIGCTVEITADDFDTDQTQIGPGYARSTPACLEAIDLMARTEGVLLDPVYTAKAMAGLIADVRSEAIGANETVVFVHTGGAPALFMHAGELASLHGAAF